MRPVPLHREKHPDLDIDGCFGCKIASVSLSAVSFKREREGTDVSGGMGTREYVRDMYEKRRAAGMEDPVPENSKAARYAPARGIFR